MNTKQQGIAIHPALFSLDTSCSIAFHCGCCPDDRLLATDLPVMTDDTVGKGLEKIDLVRVALNLDYLGSAHSWDGYGNMYELHFVGADADLQLYRAILVKIANE